MRTSTKFLVSLLFIAGSSTAWATPAYLSDDLQVRAQQAGDILHEMVSIPDDTIPESLLQRATCIATFPHVVRIGLGIGVRFGKGLASCRVPGGWSDPSFMSIKGGSWGLQIGAAATDLVLVFVTESAPERLSVGNFTVGGDASVAVGPVGRHLEAGTDYQLRSEIYAYNRGRGLFAGLAIEGAQMSVDQSANQGAYGESSSAGDLLRRANRSQNATVQPYIDALNDTAPALME